MNARRMTAIAAGAALTLALAGQVANAQPMGGPGYGPGYGPGPGRGPAAVAPAERVAKRLDWLKAELQIKGPQESAWNSYATAAKSAADGMFSRMQALRAAPPQASAPERLDNRIAAMRAGLASMESLSTATKELYAALSPEQKVVADRWMAKGWGGHGWGGGRGGRPMGPGGPGFGGHHPMMGMAGPGAMGPGWGPGSGRGAWN